MNDRTGLLEVETLTDPQVEDLWRLYREEWWTAERSLAQTQAIVSGSTVNLGIVAAETGSLVAYSRAISDGVTKALVLDVIVAASHRGLQLGARQIERMLAHPRLAGVQDFELYCRPELIPFYARWNFAADLGELRFMRMRR